MNVLAKQPVLIDFVFPKTKIVGVTKNVVLVLSFGLLTALAAQISFWIGPVPITGQTFAVLISGILLGSVRGALSQIFYLLFGLTSFPFWFAAGSSLGIARLIGPTGGYLIGFVAAAFLVGKLAESGWDKNIKTAVSAMVLGSMVIYVFGLARLANFIPVQSLLQVGFFPFVLGDLLKIFLAGLLLPTAWKYIKRSNN
jgi:biotin transporter BioY